MGRPSPASGWSLASGTSIIRPHVESDSDPSRHGVDGQIRPPEAFEPVSKVETFHASRTSVSRTIDGHVTKVELGGLPRDDRSPSEEFDRGWLRTKKMDHGTNSARAITLVDLFAGCGGLTLGIREACRALGYGMRVQLANDVDRGALAVYAHNFRPIYEYSEPVETLFNGAFQTKPSPQERKMLKEYDLEPGVLDFLVGGPPCQGHSDLNNHTRRYDPKNSLYARMARAAEILQPRHVLIENVPGARHDRSGAVETTRRILEGIKTKNSRKLYRVVTGILHAQTFGVAQTRRRYFMVATQDDDFNFDRVINDFSVPERPLEWAIGDLVSSVAADIYNSPSKATAVNQRRMDWFFTQGKEEYNLPNKERPDCHKNGGHSYVGVYGRMMWDAPAPTITGGFGCSGQGRFVHPMAHRGRGRTLTPHEAARVQFFPDFFDFSPLWETGLGARTALHQMIGNAVPSKFAYVLALSLLRAG